MSWDEGSAGFCPRISSNLVLTCSQPLENCWLHCLGLGTLVSLSRAHATKIPKSLFSWRRLPKTPRHLPHPPRHCNKGASAKSDKPASLHRQSAVPLLFFHVAFVTEMLATQLFQPLFSGLPDHTVKKAFVTQQPTASPLQI